MFCLHGCMCTMFLPAACPQRPKGAGSQGTGIPDGVIDHIGAWNQIQVFLRATSAVKCVWSQLCNPWRGIFKCMNCKYL